MILNFKTAKNAFICPHWFKRFICSSVHTPSCGNNSDSGVWEFLFSADFLFFENFSVQKFQLFRLFSAYFWHFTLISHCFSSLCCLWPLTPLQTSHSHWPKMTSYTVDECVVYAVIDMVWYHLGWAMPLMFLSSLLKGMIILFLGEGAFVCLDEYEYHSCKCSFKYIRNEDMWCNQGKYSVKSTQQDSTPGRLLTCGQDSSVDVVVGF